jgi:hypothetical protein
MSTENENLFEGIKILTPQEVESQAEPVDTDNAIETDNEVDSSTSSSEDGLNIVIPEKNESGEVETTEDFTLNQDSEKESSNPMSAKYAALIKDMMKDEIFAGVEEEQLEELLKDASADTIKKLIQHTANTAFNNHRENWANSFDGAKRRFLELEDKFTDTDEAIRMAQQLDFLDNVTDDQIEGNTDLQKQLYYNYLMSKNFSQQEAVEMIEEADGIDKLLEKARSSLPALKQQAVSVVQNAEQQRETMIKQNQATQAQNYQNLMNTVDTTEEFVPGMKLNKVTREKIKKNMTTPIHQDEQGRQFTSLMYKQLRNPLEFQALMSYYDELGLFNVDKEGRFNPNIEKLKTTRAVQELDQVLANDDERGVGRGNSTKPTDRQTGLLSMLERGLK